MFNNVNQSLGLTLSSLRTGILYVIQKFLLDKFILEISSYTRLGVDIELGHHISVIQIKIRFIKRNI